MTYDTVPDDDLRGMARRAGYDVWRYKGHRGTKYVLNYSGSDKARLALRRPVFANETDAWARAVGLAMEFKS